jgi:hypothetical protein
VNETRIDRSAVTPLLLALILVVLVAQALSIRANDARDVEDRCLWLQYDYNAETGERERQTFSEMDESSRATADLYDCDVEGR